MRIRRYLGVTLVLSGGLVAGIPSFTPFPLAAQTRQAPEEARSWLECTGDARPLEDSQPSAYQPIPRVSAAFDSVAVVASLAEEASSAPDDGCVLFLVRWTRERVLESHGILESSIPDEVAARVETALLAGQRPSGARLLFYRVLVRLTPEVEIAMGFPWETPPILENPEEVDGLLDGVFLEGVSRRNAIFQLRIPHDGPPAGHVITHSSGHPRVDRQIEFLLPYFRFRAARVEGVPYERWVSFPVMIPTGRE